MLGGGGCWGVVVVIIFVYVGVVIWVVGVGVVLGVVGWGVLLFFVLVVCGVVFKLV